MQHVPANEWYSSVRLALGVTHIFEPYVREFYRCNIWHVLGRDRCLLVDSGLGVVSLAGQFPWLRNTPVLALATHTHFDHIGNHHEFDARACHPAEAGILAAPTRPAIVADRFVSMEMFEQLPPDGFDTEGYSVRPAPPTQLVESGDVIDLGDRCFTVIHLPGHSPGSIALWEEATGMLLSGDTIYDGPLVDDVYHSNKEDYRESLLRLRSLPVNVVHGGHFASFGRTRYLELIDEYAKGARVV